MHGTKSAVFKKQFRPYWNESIGANDSGSRSLGQNDNSVNVHSQTEFELISNAQEKVFSKR